MISIVMPTYNERENIAKIAEELFKLKGSYNLELVIVDDNSPDGTGEVAEELAKKYNVKVVHRAGKLGLSSAVLEGFQNASGEIIGVMDADLSHPANKVSEMIDCLLNENVDIAIGSRLIKDGGVEEWPFHRKIVSWGATMLARPLTSVKDPMSGFFFFKKEVIKDIKLNPIGYKILLEILAKGNYKSFKEIPYTFLNRSVGSSKLDIKEHINYIRLLFRLYRHKMMR